MLGNSDCHQTQLSIRGHSVPSVSSSFFRQRSIDGEVTWVNLTHVKPDDPLRSGSSFMEIFNQGSRSKDDFY